MKAQMLKIAGVKTEKAFYKKYPTEAAFFKAHPEAKKLVKAQMGAYIGGETAPTPEMVPFQEYLNQADKMVTGFTEEERRKRMKEEAEASQKDSGSGGGMGMSGMMSMFSNMGGGMSGGGARYGTHIPKAQWGNETEGPLSSNPGFVEGMGQNNINGYGVNNAGYTTNGNATTGYNATSSGGGNGTFDAMKGVPVIGGIIKGVAALEAEKKAKKAAEQAFRTSQITLAASATKPEQIKRRYVTPWDNPVQPGQMFPPNGVGSNILAAKNGTEIQNTYAPGTLYDDLGYEPMYDSENYIPKAQFGIASAGGEGFGENPYGSMGGTSGSSQIGGSIGSIFGPAGGMVGSIIGGAFDKNQSAIDRYNRGTAKNIQAMSLNNGFRGLVGGYSSHMEDGGYISNDWTPQVITQFGGLDQQDFYDYAHEGMNSLRSGGHLRSDYMPISNRGMQTYAMGGELKTHWGGQAETMSHNPFLPGDGETVMFRGQSHDESDGKGNTGIGITYGNSPVEVERGEPAVKLKDGGSNEENLTVYGNLQIPNEYLPILDDPRAKGKKFKNYVALISKDEARQNKTIEKSTSMLNDLDVKTPFDKLKFDALTANINGANMKLKDIADKKINAAHLQNAINDTAEEYGLIADDLAKGKAKFNPEAQEEYARYGKSIKKAQNGTTSTPEVTPKLTKDQYKELQDAYIKAKVAQKGPEVENFQKLFHKYLPNKAVGIIKELGKSRGITDRGKKLGLTEEELQKGENTTKILGSNEEGLLGPRTEKYWQVANEVYNEAAPTDSKPAATTKKEEDKKYQTTDYKRSKLMDLANQVLPFIRPTDQEPLDYNQLMGEMYALSNNQVEPVQAQSYQPDLGTPYDISYQDQLNANQADYNATQKMVGYNPSAQAILNAQKYSANEKVLGEQFRQNQAMKMGVYDENRKTLNDAKLKNLDIFDRQYVRQEQAKSNSKAVAQAALNSISDKYAKNKAANRELGIYENLYNYRYDAAGRAINMNPLYQPNLPTMYGKQNNPNYVPVKDSNGNIIEFKAITPEQTTYEETKQSNTSMFPQYSSIVATQEDEDPIPPLAQKNGGKTKKSFMNGSIVKSYKNI